MPRAEPDELERLARPAPRLPLLAPDLGVRRIEPNEPRLHARVLADHHVLDRGHRPEQADVLERPRHAAPVIWSGRLRGDVLAVEDDLPAVGL